MFHSGERRPWKGGFPTAQNGGLRRDAWEIGRNPLAPTEKGEPSKERERRISILAKGMKGNQGVSWGEKTGGGPATISHFAKKKRRN